MTTTSTASERAVALLASVPASDRNDFASRAAACYLLAGMSLDGFDAFRIWPGSMCDYTPTSAVENARMAAEILAAARDRRRISVA